MSRVTVAAMGEKIIKLLKDERSPDGWKFLQSVLGRLGLNSQIKGWVKGVE